MLEIIPPVDRKLIIDELTPDKFVKYTNFGNNEIYIVTWHNSPNVVTEIGRLREITFRDAGGGTGLDCDLDQFDKDPDVPFKQLFVWDPNEQEIIGGYRFIHGKELRIRPDGQVDTPTTELFTLSDTFVKDYLPWTIELGRSFVQPAYQPNIDVRKGMYALDNIWNGLGAIIVQNPDVKYFFGKITMYPHYNTRARDLILHFMNKYFNDHKNLVYPKQELELETPVEDLESFFTAGQYDKDYRLLVQEVRRCNENIPPLVNVYMSLSSTMLCFGTSLNPGFGNVEETGILVTIDDVYDIKKERHITPSPRS
ncbi:MAG TPA: GNAT family N-acetyltransferase [Bacteroidales bacterium]|nr:GNAT family N-acetyltransferase [Bacteroidales bacterium]HPT02743.1 GNAT family N-acetyltransferase [Bacteroidales bacterium]